MKKEKSKFLKNIKKTWPYIKECKLNLVGYTIHNIYQRLLELYYP
ncbi:MAG: hypothetical protein V8R01_06950 [Bacilli bacterium]